jgi:hypothetical protein
MKLIPIILILISGIASATGYHGEETTNIYNYYTTEVTELTNGSTLVASGVSNGDLLSISSSLLAGGAHQFDYSTTKWQFSVTGDFALVDWDSENEYSVGVGKRFGKDSWVPKALFHASYTPVLGDDHVTIGMTFVLE